MYGLFAVLEVRHSNEIKNFFVSIWVISIVLEVHHSNEIKNYLGEENHE